MIAHHDSFPFHEWVTFVGADWAAKSQGGLRVALTVVDSDRYGRKVAEVRLPDGTTVQEVLARSWVGGRIQTIPQQLS